MQYRALVRSARAEMNVSHVPVDGKPVLEEGDPLSASLWKGNDGPGRCKV